MKRQPKPVIDYTTWTVEQFEEELRTNPKYEDYFEDFEAASVQKFIKQHAASTVGIFSRLDAIRKEYEAHQTLFLTLADEMIDMILQKKLFNLQCLWRAGKVDLPIVTLTTDFQYFENHIRACPFIEPVTQREIDLAMRFLKEKRWTEFDKHGDWQDYYCLKAFVEKEAFEYMTFPSLYTFFDEHQDTAFLIRLPDLRLEKEQYYIWTLRDAKDAEARKRREEQGEPEPFVNKDSLPHIHYSRENRKRFSDLCEPKQIQEALRMQVYSENYYQTLWDMEEPLALMARMKGDIPMQAHADWKTAIIESVRAYKQDQIAAFLQDAYEIYMIEFEDEEPQKTIERRVAAYDSTDLIENDHFHKRKSQAIIEGRVFVGEPADLNYLSS